MNIILLGTGDMTLKVLKKIKKDSRIELVGVICDPAVNRQTNMYYAEQMKKLGGRILEYSEENLSLADMIFTCECRKIIPAKYVKKYKFINCHAGILPKYKGFSSNVWAIMNGEKEVGYTIHQMSEIFDSGDILYVGRFMITEEQTYSDIYDEIFGDMVKRVCDVLVDTYCGKIIPVKQEGVVVYNSKFYPNLGNLSDFNMTSEYIYNLYRCMAKPHGTGVFFWYKEKKYYVGKIQKGTKFGVVDYIGLPGRVVNCVENTIWVKTKDNIVVLSEIVSEEGEDMQSSYFMIGNKFGKL